MVAGYRKAKKTRQHNKTNKFYSLDFQLLKYRRLTKEELEPLAEDFAIFLASNSIDKKMWDELKSTQKEDAEQLLDVFSDMVFEKALASAKYLERIADTELQCYYFLPKSAHLVSLRYTGQDTFSFFDTNAFQQIPELLKSDALEIIQGTKTYKRQREEEMFPVLNTGATIARGELYRTLIGLL